MLVAGDTRSCSVGVQAGTAGRRRLEAARPLPEAHGIAEVCFSPRERSELAALPPGGLGEAVLHGCTMKKAYVKGPEGRTAGLHSQPARGAKPATRPHVCDRPAMARNPSTPPPRRARLKPAGNLWAVHGDEAIPLHAGG